MSYNFWNPWHGCEKVSAGCANCYMYELDAKRGQNGSIFHVNKNDFKLPLKKNRSREYKIRPGSIIRVCMTSDFFIKEADPYRPEIWDVMKFRSDVVFVIITKRPERIASCLPGDWGPDGYSNVWMNVTTEDQKAFDERIGYLKDIPAAAKGLFCAPLLSDIDFHDKLVSHGIRQVIVTGEQGREARPCDADWIQHIYEQCRDRNIRCHFVDPCRKLVKDGCVYEIPYLSGQSAMAYESPWHHKGRPIRFDLKLPGTSDPVPEDMLRTRLFCRHCNQCASHYLCDGCRGCNRCGQCGMRIPLPEFENDPPYHIL